MNVWSMAGCDQTAYMDAWKICYKTTCTSLPEDEHLDVRNMSKAPELNYNTDEKNVHTVGSYYIDTVKHFMFHLVRSAQCQLSQAKNMTVNFIHVRFYSVQPRDPLFPIEAMNSDFTLLPYRETSWSWGKALAFCADLEFEAKYHVLLPPTVKTYIYRKYQASTLDQIPHKVMGTSAIYHLNYTTSQSPKFFPCFKICILTSCQTDRIQDNYRPERKHKLQTTKQCYAVYIQILWK
jgi:hypothetical protein